MKFVLLALVFLTTSSAKSNEFKLAEISRANEAHEIAVKLYEAASEKGNPLASHWAGTYYMDGVGVKKDTAKAFKLFSHAANNEIAGSMVYLANMYLLGIGTKKDCEKSKFWISKASDGKIPEGWRKNLESCL